ncbi:hypothetical protein DBR32_02980 [Taibaiella sp. KBW10]|uniref:hypothetical protein n=1 Tax=Taibaiella sp. KBW10 TaxID=2153357 RepID=UPI000F5B4B1B|nr:hypothetical protein [Taibaiella sp. KBW10]RQO32576.1 hypothetical protein DBR32_02980 [Taibaiella sp. KBW10]
MGKRYGLLLLLFTYIQGHAQTLKDKAFNGVIRIDDNQVAEIAGNYLVDIPLPHSDDKAYVFFLDAHMPVSLFQKANGFFPNLKEFILIVPDWAYYDDVAKSIRGTGIYCAEPIATNIYYHIKREGAAIHIDSLRMQGSEQPELSFRKQKTSFKDTLVVYRTETYGGGANPKDPMLALEQEDAPFIRDYEKQHKLRITGTFKQYKERKVFNYYTLPGLSTAQRLQFLLAKRGQWILNRQDKFILFAPEIFTPQLMPFEKEGAHKMTPVNYDK